jgi:hypothetical protein
MKQRVKATREGLAGQRTSSGYVIDGFVSFAALPAAKALHRHVRITNPANTTSALAEVLDVGPWNIADDLYVFGGARPLAERGWKLDPHNPHGALIQGATNGAGIDLSERVWKTLGMLDNGMVDWEFI